MSTIEERVKKIIGEQLGVKQEEVTNNASFVEDRALILLTPLSW
nr:Fatty acid synthase acyl carrier protein [Klebsiella pneumoniae]